jgi:FKBP-type peptidyl-prolyl cis-trans isomerase 2
MNRTDAICLLVVILVIVGIVSLMTYSWYQEATNEPKKKDQGLLNVREGDTITCEFTEWILTRDSTGEIKYCVYQTTDESIAEDETIPKSVTFQQILVNNTGVPITRDALTKIVGSDLSDELNPGFNNIVIDMKEGESRTGVEIPASEGYGEKNDELIQTIPISDSIPIYISKDRFAFEGEYSDELPSEPGKTFEPGQTFEDHYWGWNIRIHSITNDTIVIKNEPTLDMELAVFSWPAKVINISSEDGTIWIKHKPDISIVNTPIDAEVLEFYNPRFTEIRDLVVETQQPYPGIIISIENGITIDFNRENIGKSLKYDLTIVKIIRD